MSPKLDKLLVGIGDLEVAKTCTLSLEYAPTICPTPILGYLCWVTKVGALVHLPMI